LKAIAEFTDAVRLVNSKKQEPLLSSCAVGGRL
jgi:hypothetical protein